MNKCAQRARCVGGSQFRYPDSGFLSARPPAPAATAAISYCEEFLQNPTGSKVGTPEEPQWFCSSSSSLKTLCLCVGVSFVLLWADAYRSQATERLRSGSPRPSATELQSHNPGMDRHCGTSQRCRCCAPQTAALTRVCIPESAAHQQPPPKKPFKPFPLNCKASSVGSQPLEQTTDVGATAYKRSLEELSKGFCCQEWASTQMGLH